MEVERQAKQRLSCTVSVSVVHSRVGHSGQTEQRDLLPVLVSGSVSAASVMYERQVGSGREEGGVREQRVGTHTLWKRLSD